MSAYSDWKCGAITEEEYRSAMRREYEEHYPDDVPFYTDDPDDPHWKCENCGHRKEYKMYRRIIDQHPQYYQKGNSSVTCEDHKFYTLWVTPDHKRCEMESIWLCELDRTEHMDDHYCEDFIEAGE